MILLLSQTVSIGLLLLDIVNILWDCSSRKAILLLFIVTEDFLLSNDLTYGDQGESDAAWFMLGYVEPLIDQFESVVQKLNLFLDSYGMNQLDPGNPFDCLVLYALAAENGDDFLGDRFSSALAQLFKEFEDTPKEDAESLMDS